MLLSPLDSLYHIRDESEFILSATNSKSKKEITTDPVLQRAILRSPEVIGEATKHLDFSFRNKYPQVDWKGMAGTRDKLIHDYIEVDYDLVYDIVINEIPSLQHEINRIIIIEENV
jgi:uncharacterized protein with HEPN domain